MGKGVKLSAPKITVGKDLGLKNIGKATSGVVKSVGDVGSQVVKTVGKGTEGLVSGVGDVASALSKGDLKGVGSEALGLLQSGKDIATGLTKAGLTAGTGTLGATGSLIGDKNITKAATDIQREGTKGVDTYGDAAIDIGANLATAGTYGLAQQAASSLAGGGIEGLLSGKGIQDALVSAAGSYAGVDPSLLKAGLSAAKGDLKGAALSGLGSFGDFDPNTLKMASTGVSALTGDKAGLASGLASQFGAGESTAKMLGGVAGGDLKGTLLKQLAGATGVDPKLLSNISQGKIDPMQIAGALGLDSKKLLGSAADTFGINALTNNPMLQDVAQTTQRAVESADPYIKDAQNAATDIQQQALQAKNMAESTYKIAKGDTLNAIAKKMGVDPAVLAAANNIKDPNKIIAGMDLKIPSVPQFDQAKLDELRKAQGEYEEIQPGMMSKIGDYVSNIPGNISKAVSKAGSDIAEFAQKNPNLSSALVQGAGGVAGYLAGTQSRDAQADIIKKRLEEAGKIGSALGAIKETPKFAEQEAETRRLIEGGGMTPELKLASEMGLRKGQQVAASGRQAAMELGKATGQVSGRGASLAGALTAAQMGGNVVSDTEKQLQAEAYNRKLAALKDLSGMEQSRFQNIQSLATAQDAAAANRVAQTSAARTAQQQLEQAKGEATGQLIAGATNVVQGFIPTKANIEAGTATAPKVDQSKIDAAKQLSQTGTTQKTPTTSTTTNKAPTTSTTPNKSAPTTLPQFNDINIAKVVQDPQKAIKEASATAKNYVEQKAGDAGKAALGMFGIKL